MAANLEPSSDLTERSSIYLSKEVQLDISLNRSTKQNDSPDSFEITQFNNGQLSRKVTLSDDGQFLLGTEYVAGVAVRNYILTLPSESRNFHQCLRLQFQKPVLRNM